MELEYIFKCWVTLYSLDFKQVYTVARYTNPSAYVYQNWPLQNYYLSSNEYGEYLRLNIEHVTKVSLDSSINITYSFDVQDEEIFLKECSILVKKHMYKEDFKNMIGE